ncbi:MAG: TIGR03009 domain-containing protein [Thermoguttaceae bacterium]|nr:TIGR03009 domain-containing protein [Thermoguttaceae bacterium]MDW8078256.1 TIGR03009 domain-containing protein [Thermoguttaceae bacterium]
MNCINSSPERESPLTAQKVLWTGGRQPSAWWAGFYHVVCQCLAWLIVVALAQTSFAAQAASSAVGQGPNWTPVPGPGQSNAAGPTWGAGGSARSTLPTSPAAPAAMASAQPRQEVLGAPFVLTPEEERALQQVLQRWEEATSKVKTLECRFTRFQYDPVFGPPNTPVAIDQGEIKYAAPNKGLFRVFQPKDISEPRAEQWICDGKAIYEFDYSQKQLIEYPLPPEAQERPMSAGPLPFVFGAKAAELRNRYYLRLVTPSQAQGQVWLEAWPKWQSDAANFQRATMIILWQDMTPFALELVEPNGKNRTVFRFQDMKINAKNILDPLGLFEESWVKPRTPPGWSRVVKELPAAEAAQRPR